MLLAHWVILLLEIYLGLGLLFAIFFVSKGVGNIDPTAKAGTVGFRILIIPGVMVFWPLLAKRWWQGATEPPKEKNQHRILAREKNA